MSLLLGYSSNGGGGSSGGSNGSSSGAGSGHHHGASDLLYQDVARALSSGGIGMTTHDTCGQVNDWHHHHSSGTSLTQDPRHLQDLHSPYSLESDSAIGLSPSPDLSLGGLSSYSNNCMSIGSSSCSSTTTKHEDIEAAASAGAYGTTAPPPAKKSRRRGGRGTPRTPPRQSIDVNDNSLFAVYELFKSFLSASTASTVAIDNKIEQAMDLVKSHLMFAVREEVEVLKEKITELMERINQLEYENTVLKQYATNEALQQIQQHHNSNT